jgi:F-type H+-transporting ATPase subunit delta
VDVALDQQAADRVRGELQQAAGLLGGHALLMQALTHPTVGAEGRKRLVEELWGRRGAAPLVRRFLALLAERNRMALLPAVAEDFAALLNERRGVVTAEAVAATPLDAAQEAALRQAIEQAAGRPAEVRTTVDPELLGGVVVRMGGRTYDGSVRRRLQSLRERLAGEQA